MVKIELTGYTGKESKNKGKIVVFSVSAGARVSGTKSADGKFEYNSEWYDCISFDTSLKLAKGTKVKVNATMEYNEYNGKLKPRYVVDKVEVL